MKYLNFINFFLFKQGFFYFVCKNYKMVQQMIDRKKFDYELKNKSVGTQTGDENERCITISDTKKIRLYYSKSYKDYIISFDLNESKKFILSKEKWLLP